MEYYTLKNDELEVTFKSLGGELHSIRDRDGVEYLWQGDPQYWSGQAPVLFPICGSLRGDIAEIGKGKTANMPRHGIVRKKEFQCEYKTEKSVTFAIESTKEMLEQYPYPFKLRIRYSLHEKKIQVHFFIENRGNETMPYMIGGHPAFNCPLLPGEDFTDYKLVFEKTETCSVPALFQGTGLIDMHHRRDFLMNQKELPLTHEMFADDALHLDALKSRSVKLVSDKNEKGVQIDFRSFPFLTLWSAAHNAPFVAIEPWQGLSTCSDESDVFEEKRNVQFAGPGEHKTCAYTITIL